MMVVDVYPALCIMTSLFVRMVKEKRYYTFAITREVLIFVQHFGNDVYLAWRLMEYVAKEVGVKPGYLYHTIDSLHAYKKDWTALASNLEDLQEKY